jgi:hypothetical protein
MRRLAFSWNDWTAIAAVALACGLAAYIGMPVCGSSNTTSSTR